MSSRWIKFFLVIYICLGQMSIDLYLPSMPAMVHALHTIAAHVQLTMSSFLIGYAGSQLVYGALADCYGRKPLMLVGLFIFCLATLLILLTSSISVLILLRLLQGIGIGAASTLSRTILRDALTGKHLERMSAYMAIAWAVVPLLAPILGSYVQRYLNWRYNFAIMLTVGLSVLVLTMRFLPETLLTAKGQFQLRVLWEDYCHILCSKTFTYNVFVLLALYAAMIIFNLAAPFLLQVQLGVAPELYGWIILLIASGNIFGSLLAVRLVQHYSVEFLIGVGLGMYLAIAFLLLIFAWLGLLNIGVIAIPGFLLFVASGIAYPGATAVVMKPFSRQAGSASALCGCITIIGGSLFSIVMSYLPETSLLPLAILLVILSVSVMTAFLRYLYCYYSQINNP